MSTSVLDRLVADAHRRAGALRRRAGALRRAAASRETAPCLAPALAGRTVAVVAEVKRRSPSAGPIRPQLDAAALAQAYVAGGAAAVSVLTEADHFGGSLADLEAVATAVPVPVLRKDFLVDPLQLLESRAAGASAVLLIARAVSPRRLALLARAARDVGLETLVEAHTAPELDAALAARATAVGVNTRDLGSFQVDLGLAERLLPRIPREVLAVAESGIAGRPDVERLAAAGADAVLVGTHVVAAADPTGAVRELVGVARRGRG